MHISPSFDFPGGRATAPPCPCLRAPMLAIKRSWAQFPVGPLSSYLGQLSLPSLWGRQIEHWPGWLGLRRGAFTCVGWQVTLCDPIWQVIPHSSEMVPMKSYTHLFLLVTRSVQNFHQCLKPCKHAWTTVEDHVCILILFTQTLALYKTFTYLLTYLLTWQTFHTTSGIVIYHPNSCLIGRHFSARTLF